eukprot:SAG22_NODE_716_length_7715_cov_6.435399_3_plen_1185_part_00
MPTGRAAAAYPIDPKLVSKHRQLGGLSPHDLNVLLWMLDDDGNGQLGAHELVDVFDGVDNDQLTLTDCAGETFPHHWLGDGICDNGEGDRGIDLNCNIFNCDDGDCGSDSCAVLSGDRGPVEITPDVGWVGASLGASLGPGQQALYMFDATNGTTYWVATRLSAGAGGLADSVLSILDETLEQVAQNDNLGRGTRASALTFTAAITGPYVVKVRSYNPLLGGDYSLQVATDRIVFPGTVPCTAGNQVRNAMTTCEGFNGDSCRYLCMAGYRPSGEHVCDELTAVFSGGACEPIACTGGFTIERSDVTCAGGTGEVCDFECEEGYVPIGAHVCQRNGNFAGGSCGRVICTVGLQLANSPTNCEGVYEDVCEYTCQDGYTATGAHTCTANGTFTGGSCDVNSCSGGLTIPNSDTVCAGVLGDQCDYNCTADYGALGEHFCEASGDFAGGTCLRKCTGGYTLANSPTDCNTSGVVGWSLAVRTSNGRHEEWGTFPPSNSGVPRSGDGVFNPFYELLGVTQVKIVRTADGAEGTYAFDAPLEAGRAVQRRAGAGARRLRDRQQLGGAVPAGRAGAGPDAGLGRLGPQRQPGAPGVRPRPGLNERRFEFTSGNLKGYINSKCNDGNRPTSTHLIIIDQALSPNSNQAVGDNLNQDIDTVSGIGPGSIIYYMMYATSRGFCLDEAHHLKVFQEVVANFDFTGGSAWPEQTLKVRSPAYAFSKYRLAITSTGRNRNGFARVRELKFFSKYPSQSVLGSTWCSNDGDTDADCIDAEPPSTGQSCRCSDGYEDIDGVCTQLSACAGNPCGNRGDNSSACFDNPAPSTGYTCRCSAGFATTMQEPAECADMPDWESASGGWSCADFGDQNWCTAAGEPTAAYIATFGGHTLMTDFDSSDGVPVTMACCVCGGGSYAFPALATDAPVCTGLYPTASCAGGMANTDLDDSTPCVPCAAGRVPREEDSEEGEQQKPGTSVCDACPAGTADTDFNPATPCGGCAAGTFAPEASTECTGCAAGTADLDGSAATPCEDCLPGRYAAGSAASCEQCAVGRQSRSTASPCEDCVAGYVDDDRDATTLCSPCHAGSYSALSRGTSCTMCTAGQATADPAAACQACGAGTVATVGERQYEFLSATTLTEVATDGVAGHTTYRLGVTLAEPAANVYGMFGNVDHPLTVPAAFQAASPAGVDVGGW